MGICKIFGAGERIPKERVCCTCRSDGDDLVIAADGGLAWLTEELPDFGVDIFIGDMDSLKDDTSSIEKIGEVIKLPVEKDDTDMGAAVSIGFERGYKTFCLYGGTGGRWDHTIANLQLLKHIALSGGHGFLVGPKLTAIVVSGEQICTELNTEPGRLFSVFAMGKAEGVTIRGGKYDATDATLTDDYALGVSNESVLDRVVIEQKKGTLLIVGEFLPNEVTIISQPKR